MDRAFKDCVVIETSDYHKMSEFLFEMAMKVARTTVHRLNRKWKKSSTDAVHFTEALKQLLTGVWDIIDEVREP